jgi:hypothetical protein
MGQQSEIFSKYRSLFNSKNVRQGDNETSRKLDNMDFVDFLFEMVRSTKCQKQFKNIILKGSLSKLKKADELNDIITKQLLADFGCDETLLIPTKYTTKATTGIELDKAEIDAFGLLGIDPDKKPGNFVYEGNDPKKHMNYVFYKAQGAKSTNPLTVNYKDRVLYTLYAITPNTFMFKFGEFYENKLFGDWLKDYMTLINPIFNMVNFTTILVDLLTGAISLKAKKNKFEIKKESGVIKAMQKIFGFCSETPNNSGDANKSANDLLKNQLNNSTKFNGDGQTGTQVGFGNLNNNNNNNNASGETETDPFDFDATDLDEIEQDANLRSLGKIRFSTCGNLDIDINPDDIIAGLDELFANSNVNEIYSYGDTSTNNQLPNTSNTLNSGVDGATYDNSKVDANVDKASDFFDNALNQGAQKALDGGEDTIKVNLPSMNAELQLNILKAIPYALMRLILTPKLLVIPKLHAVLSGDTSKKPVEDFIKNMKTTIAKIGEKITSLLIQNIFDSIKADLVKLGKDLVIEYLKQRGKDYFATYQSLLMLLNLFKGGAGCGGVLSKLLKILNFVPPVPQPPVPPPLILIGGALKPGMNKVALVNDIKSKLNERGIETAATLPDGTPNNMMIAIEETVGAMLTHIKTSSTIQTFGIGPTGPVAGYGQIQ